MEQEIYILLKRTIKSKKNGKIYDVITAYFVDKNPYIQVIFISNDNAKESDIGAFYDYTLDGGHNCFVTVSLQGTRVNYGKIIEK